MVRAAKPAQPKLPTPIDALTHEGDKRMNNPTVELLDFVPEEPPKKLRYPRDTSLDPQLVWHGKDEQDAATSKCQWCQSTAKS